MLALMLAFGVASVLSCYISRRPLLVICFSVRLPAKSRVLPSPSTLWIMFRDPECLSHMPSLQLSVSFVCTEDYSSSSGSVCQLPMNRFVPTDDRDVRQNTSSILPCCSLMRSFHSLFPARRRKPRCPGRLISLRLNDHHFWCCVTSEMTNAVLVFLLFSHSSFLYQESLVDYLLWSNSQPVWAFF